VQTTLARHTVSATLDQRSAPAAREVRRQTLMLEPLVDAFSATFEVPVSGVKIADDEALDYTTIHDGFVGVQWMYLQEWEARQGYVVLNLEGLEYEGWPIARVLEQELDSVRLLNLARTLPDSELLLFRDGWTSSGSRVPIENRRIGQRAVASEVRDADWRQMLTEAYDCLSAARDHRGPEIQEVETAKGTVRLHVSPHLQIRLPIRRDFPVSFCGGAVSDFLKSRPTPKAIGLATEWLADWRSVLAPAQRALTPLRRLLDEQTRA